MAKRFRLHPGQVRSLSDGEYHFVDGAKLAALYGLDPAECVIVTDGPLSGNVDPSLIPLHPLRDGRYKEHLQELKLGDFRRYVKARKLLIYHESGASPYSRSVQATFAERQRKSVAWHEKHWPDFPAAYKRYTEEQK